MQLTEPVGFLIGDLNGEPEICEFNFSVLVLRGEEEVLRFDVSVNYVHAVTILYTLQDLLHAHTDREKVKVKVLMGTGQRESESESINFT